MEEPQEYCCPITHTLMKEPVIDNQGISYEKDAIEEWLNLGNTISPITNMSLIKSDLRPNINLKNIIELYMIGNTLTITDYIKLIKE